MNKLWAMVAVVGFACLFAVPVRADVERVLTANAPAALESQPVRRNASPAGNTASRPTTQKAATPAPATGSFDVPRVFTALAVVVILILLLRWVAKRFFGVTGVQRSTRAVQVLSRSPLSPRQQLVLLRVGRRLLVVADGGGQMNTLSEITDGDEVAALLGQLQDDHADRSMKSFGNLFGKMRGSYEHDPDETEERQHDADGRLAEQEGEPDKAVDATRQELSGLMNKVQLLSRQFKSQ